MNSDHPSTTAATNDRPSQVWTVERIRALGAVTDITTAGQIFGLSRSRAYQLAATDTFPARVLCVGSRYRVSVAAILTALGVDPDPPPAPRHRTVDLTLPPNHASISTDQSDARPGQHTRGRTDERTDDG